MKMVTCFTDFRVAVQDTHTTEQTEIRAFLLVFAQVLLKKKKKNVSQLFLGDPVDHADVTVRTLKLITFNYLYLCHSFCFTSDFHLQQ